jgi:hypothetical protein
VSLESATSSHFCCLQQVRQGVMSELTQSLDLKPVVAQ